MGKAILLLLVGTWLGLVVGLSFVEAPLKFQAPDMTIKLGLGIGRLVFGALNKMEMIMSLALIIGTLKYYSKNNTIIALVVFIILIVIIQTVWLLPALDKRVEIILAGVQVESSYHHILYILMEISKVIILPILFNRLYKCTT